MNANKKVSSESNPKKADKNYKTKEEKEKKLDQELEQTFPASDALSHTDPDRDEKETHKKEGKK